jgi:hypothetical protein
MRKEYPDGSIKSLMLSTDRKIVGRKHNHKPSSRVNEKRKAANKKHHAHKLALSKKHLANIAKYWAGEIEEYPKCTT